MAHGLTRSEQIALVGVGVLIVAGVSFEKMRASRGHSTLDAPGAGWTEIVADSAPANRLGSTPESGPVPSGMEAVRTPLNLNTATQADLEELPGIGPVRARDIILFREAAKGFRSVDDLLEVRGIGEITLAKLRPLVTVGTGAQTTTELTLPRPPPSEAVPSTGAVPVSGGGKPEKININTATKEELERIPGVGPALAGRIIEARSSRPFATPEELIEIKGIGPKTFEKMKPWVRVQ